MSRRFYLTANAISSASNKIGQIVVSTITPKTAISDPQLGCALYAYRSLRKRAIRSRIEFASLMFIADNIGIVRQMRRSAKVTLLSLLRVTAACCDSSLRCNSPANS